MTVFDVTKPHCYYFNELCKIPHGSYNEKGVSEWLVSFAKEHNLEYVQDKKLNVVIYKKASAGYESAKPLLLQAHVDMVPEKNKSSNHNFETDPLKLVVEGDWLTAEGTTLGADDGTGVAYMLAILADDELPHPDLECCFTVEEEVGLFGALALDPSLFKARRMVSLDGGGEVSTGISSAGGCKVDQTIPVDYVSNDLPTYRLFISGLTGGHSGGEIHKEKGNSNVLANRVLKEMTLAGVDIKLVSLEGGLKDNAIPRECEVIFASSTDTETMNAAMAKSVKNIKTELEFSDAGFTCTIEAIETAEKCMSDVASKRVLDYIFLLPNGFRHRSMAIEGLTLTSLNLGILRTTEAGVVVTSSLRSALESGIDNLVNIIQTLASLFGVTTEISARYPGWNYKAKSEMREKLNKVMLAVNGKPLVEMATHGGCECGVFAAMDEEFDITTYGPITEDIHTPDERLNLPSFDRAYKILTDLVKECK